MYTPVLIVGIGIAGLSVAYNLKKQGMDFLMLTKAEQIYASNSVMAPANIRMFEDINSGIDLYMKECKGNHEMIKEIYSNQDFLTEMLKELKIKYRKTPIGIIPDEITSATGGSYLIRIYLTAHYTSGGIEVGKNFKVLDNVYACGEVLFDGNKGIGRLPGHPFASAIISSKIIADEIVKNKEEYEEHNEEEVFAVQELLSRDEKDNLENNKEIFNNFATKIEEVLYNEVQIDEKKKLDDELINFLNKLKNNMKCIEELEIYYRLELLREVLKK